MCYDDAYLPAPEWDLSESSNIYQTVGVIYKQGCNLIPIQGLTAVC